MLSLEVITDYKDFISLEKEWNTLLQKSDSNIIYLTHEWISAWWESFGYDKKLSILKLKDHNHIIGIAPLMLSKRTLLKMPVNCISFIGHEWMMPSNFILVEKKEQCLQYIISWFKDNYKKWDIIQLTGIPIKSDNYSILKNIIDTEMFLTNVQNRDILYISINSNWQTYLKRTSYSFRRNNKNRKRKLEDIGAYKFDRYIKLADTDNIVSRIFDISLKSWKGKAGTSVAINESFKKFHCKLINSFGEKGQIDICILQVNGKDIAYRYGFNYNQISYEFDIAYNPDYSKISPGILVNAFVNEEIFKANMKEIELGPDFEWKNMWNPQRREESNITIFNNRKIYPRFLYLAKSYLHPLVKNLFSKK